MQGVRGAISPQARGTEQRASGIRHFHKNLQSSEKEANTEREVKGYQGTIPDQAKVQVIEVAEGAEDIA